MSVNVERMTKTLEAFKLFFDTSSAAHIVHGTEASLLYDLVFK